MAKQSISPTILTIVRASDVGSLAGTNGEEAKKDAILNSLSYAGIKKFTSSSLMDAQYQTWKKENNKLHTVLVNDLTPKKWEESNNKKLPSFVHRGTNMEIGINNELQSLEILEETLKDEDKTFRVVSDQKSRSCDIKSKIPIRISGRIDGVIYKGDEIYGIVEVKTRVYENKAKESDVMQLTCYSRMIPELQTYILLERIHQTDELKMTKFSWNNMNEKWENVKKKLIEVQEDILTTYREIQKKIVDVEKDYKDAIIDLVSFIKRIFNSLAQQGSVPVPLIEPALETLLGEINNTSADFMYSTFLEIATPHLVVKIKERDAKYFASNLSEILGSRSEKITDEYREKIELGTDVIFGTHVTDGTRNRLWERIDKIVSLI